MSNVIHLPKEMRAISIKEPGGPEMLEVSNTKVVLVRIYAN